MSWDGTERRQQVRADDSQQGTAIQLAALQASFESFASSVGSRMDRWERDVVKIVAEVKQEISDLRTEVKAEMAATAARHVTVDRFRPVERIAYGLVTLICVAVVGAVIKLVVA